MIYLIIPGTQEAHFLPSTRDLHSQPPLKSQEHEFFLSLHSEGLVPFASQLQGQQCGKL